LGFDELRDLFLRLYRQLDQDGYFTEAFGFYCVNADYIPERSMTLNMKLLIKLRKKNTWPIEKYYEQYTEDDLFNVT